MRNLILVSLVTLVSACTTIPARNAEYEKSGSMDVEVKRISTLAERCWSRKQTPFVDGKLVQVRKSLEGYTEVSEHDYASDLGVNAPTTIFRFEETSKGYKVIVNQREISGAIDENDVERDQFWKAANRWIEGESNCN